MIKDNQKYFNQLHIVIDGLVVAGSYLLAWFLKFEGFLSGGSTLAHLPSFYFSALYYLVPGYLIIYYMNRMYVPKRSQRLETELASVVRANAVGAAAFMISITLFKVSDFSRGLIAIFCITNTIFAFAVRCVIRALLRKFRKKGYNLKYILIVGYSRAAEEYINRLNDNPQWGYVVRGIIDNNVPIGTIYKGVKVVGVIDDIDVILPGATLDEIAITLPLSDYDRLADIVSKCEKSGVHTKFIPDYSSLIPNRPYTEELDGLPVINIRYVPLTNTFNALVKRIFDFIFSFIGIIILSPLLLVLAVIVKCSSPGPVIFKQERIGLHNKSFNIYKYRTMRVQEASEEQKAWTTKDDPRVTKCGKVMRRFNLDELPQLFNILKGDMSLVGPRPERPQFVEQFKEEIPRYMIKHQVRPGLTGWAQVSGFRGDTSIHKRISYDLYYIENWSFGFDIKILFLTIFKGFKNAY
ncbi:MAG: undecaprenyl-phosphate glucose phosphotransferase [Lachnospiraceae bacterium]|nr:undecaprenyl-phosphate glucose phosphotransferase [Lachnospiraceae bacterium]